LKIPSNFFVYNIVNIGENYLSYVLIEPINQWHILNIAGSGSRGTTGPTNSTYVCRTV